MLKTRFSVDGWRKTVKTAKCVYPRHGWYALSESDRVKSRPTTQLPICRSLDRVIRMLGYFFVNIYYAFL